MHSIHSGQTVEQVRDACAAPAVEGDYFLYTFHRRQAIFLFCRSTDKSCKISSCSQKCCILSTRGPLQSFILIKHAVHCTNLDVHTG